MNRIQKRIALTGMCGLVLLILFPPYFGMKLPPEENLHASLGLYPLWNPPSGEIVHQKLCEIFPDAPSLKQPYTPDQFRASINTVRFILYAGIFASCTGTLLLYFRKPRGARQSVAPH